VDQALLDEAKNLLELSSELARKAGEIQLENYEQNIEITTKLTSIDLVTQIDGACEQLIVEGIRKRRPHDAILAEEGGRGCDGHADWRWVIDPLDGTTNYAHGFPCFTVSIGIEYRGQAMAGTVYHPLLGELFTALRSQGAWRNGRPIRVSRVPSLERAILATGFPYDVHTSDEDNMVHFRNFTKCAQATRRDGSAAWDLCCVACGRLDGFWEFKLKPWDVAAGFLIVDEAGGRVTNAAGGAPGGEDFVASNGLIHEAMLNVLRDGSSTPR